RAPVLAQIAAGKLMLAFCHAEPGAGYARDWVRAVARREGNGFLIDGEKTFALGAHAADTLLVSARIGSEKGPVGLFLIPRSASGIALNVAASFDSPAGAPGQTARAD